jgi:hypothetical protein
MKTFFVIRQGWNAANQSSLCRRNPRNNFESHYYKLVAIVEAVDSASAEAAVLEDVSVYNGQQLFATSNPRAYKGLTDAIRKFESVVA